MKQLLFLLCCLEVLFSTWLIGTLGPYASALLLFGISLGIPFLYLRLSSEPASQPTIERWRIPPMAAKVIQWVLFLVISYILFAKLKHLWWYFQKYGDPVSSSDVIPQIQALVTRFLAGEQPYYTIHFKEYDLFPTYLPMQWMPYILTELAHKDYRWVPAIALWGASLYYFLNNRTRGAASVWQLLVPVWPLVVWYVFMIHDNKVYVYTVEGLIAAYYFFVAQRIHKPNVLMLAVGISLCLLSRYSIVFWVPLCMALYFVAGRRREAFFICAIAALFFVAFYWYPFLRKDSSIFMSGYAYHTRAALGEWLRDLQVFDGGVYLRNGMGFTCFAFALLPGDPAQILATYKVIHLAACGLTVAGLFWFYVRRRAVYALPDFLLFSFKVYLTVFYTFIQIPYKYLFFVPVIVSAVLLGRVWTAKQSERIPGV